MAPGGQTCYQSDQRGGGTMGDQGSNEYAAGDEGRDGFSRRGFLVGAAGLTGVALSGVWKGAPALAAERATTVPTGPSSGFRFLEIDGTVVGTVQSVSGGEA